MCLILIAALDILRNPVILFLSTDQQMIVNTEIQKLALQRSAINATTIRWKINGEETTVLIYYATDYMLIAIKKKHLTPRAMWSNSALQIGLDSLCLLMGSNMNYTASLSSYSWPKILNLKIINPLNLAYS